MNIIIIIIIIEIIIIIGLIIYMYRILNKKFIPENIEYIINNNTYPNNYKNIDNTYLNNKDKKYELGLLAIYKNEEMVIDEWIKHYIWQQIDHIYLIDNGSTDNTKTILKPYIQKGLVSYFYFPEKYQQIKHYNKVYDDHCKIECKWLIVCDIDEYIYNTIYDKTIKTYINSLDYKNIAGILLNWKMFGSNNFIEQPKSIRKSFTLRKKDYDDNFKLIINTQFTSKLTIHDHYLQYNKILLTNPTEINLNHYAIMSLQYFTEIKMTRGAADSKNSDNIRDLYYFQNYDYKELIDDELKNLLFNDDFVFVFK